jgi:hypothetical protein
LQPEPGIRGFEPRNKKAAYNDAAFFDYPYSLTIPGERFSITGTGELSVVSE